MRYKKIQLLVIILLPILVFIKLKLLSRDFTKPNYTYFDDMANSEAYSAQEMNHFFADGITQRVPPKGAIARDVVYFNYENSESERERAGRELQNPIEPTVINQDRGRVVFENFCLICHGVAGRGDGVLIPKYPNPPSFITEKFKSVSDGAIYHTIVYGKNKNKMPSHASQIDDDDRWKVILHINKLRNGENK